MTDGARPGAARAELLDELTDLEVAVGKVKRLVQRLESPGLREVEGEARVGRVVEPDDAAALVHDWLSNNDGPFHVASTGIPDVPGVAPTPPALSSAIATERRREHLYHSDVLSDPMQRQVLAQRAKEGELQRVTESLPLEFTMLSNESVLVCLTKPEEHLVYHEGAFVVSLFGALFRALFDSGVSAPTQGLTLTQENWRIIELLGQGMQDQAIARYLGISLRTVRRRIAGMMDARGLTTRYQLGAAYAARASSPASRGRMNATADRSS